MHIAGYDSTETRTDAETKRRFNTLLARQQSHDTDFSVAVERGEPACWFPAHAHDLEQIFYIIEGRMEVTIAGETRAIGPREMVYVPRNAEHAGRNVGDGPLEYLVIDHWPRDSDDELGL